MKHLLFILIITISVKNLQAQWSVTGNAISSGQFIGTTNGQNLQFKANGISAGAIDITYFNSFFGLSAGGSANASATMNCAFGHSALTGNSSGAANVAIGYYSLSSNSSGSSNTGVGYLTLFNNSTGINNSAAGAFSMYNNSTGAHNAAYGFGTLRSNGAGSYNSANGAYALFQNTTGNGNTAMGYQAMYSNQTASDNTAFGTQSMYSNTSGLGNTAVGYQSLFNNTSGNNNTANGYQALYQTTTGSNNTAVGTSALAGNYADNNTAIGFRTMGGGTVTGSDNVGIGVDALGQGTAGYQNVAIGTGALYYNTGGSGNMIVGYDAGQAIVNGSCNTGFGYNAGPSGDYDQTIAIGYLATPTMSYQAMFGNPSTLSIGGYQPWTNFSDGRYKKNIQENVPGLEFISQLRPVTYTLDVKGITQHIRSNTKQRPDSKTIDPLSDPRYLAGVDKAEKVVHTGFISQEVEAAANKINYDFDGVKKPGNDKDLYGLRYGEFVPPLVKSVQQLSQANDTLRSTIVEIQSQIAQIKEEIAAIKSRNAAAATGAMLKQNAPNPFTDNTIIEYNIPANAGHAILTLTSAAGQLLRSVPINTKGVGQINIAGGSLAAGVYYYSLTIDGKLIDSKKMILSSTR